MLKEQLVDVLSKNWPMLVIFTVVISSIRIAYIITNRQKLILYRELFSLAFMLYVLILFYVVTYQDPVSNSISSYNLVPFKEMFRYDFGTVLFYKNIVGNLLIFVPFGLFVSYYLKTSRLSIIFILSLISSLTIEFAQRLIIGRVFDVDDIILNVFGAIIGYFAYVIILAIGDHIPKMLKKDWLINLIMLILMAYFLLYVLNIDAKIMEVLS